MKWLHSKWTKFICPHRLYSFIERINIQQEQKIEARCEDCGKRLILTVFANEHRSIYNRVQICKKKTYQTKKEAKTVFNICKARKRGLKPSRVYRCTRCEGWHLTSKTKHKDEYET
jgi:hypothetical protein